MSCTKEEIEFFSSKEWLEALDKLGGWKPKFGDWAIERYSGDILLVVGAHEYSVDMVPACWEGWEEGMIHSGPQKHLIWLPRLAQLIGMLKERVRPIWLGGPMEVENKRYWKVIAPPDECFGPYPTIALGKCLQEIAKNGR